MRVSLPHPLLYITVHYHNTNSVYQLTSHLQIAQNPFSFSRQKTDENNPAPQLTTWYPIKQVIKSLAMTPQRISYAVGVAVGTPEILDNPLKHSSSRKPIKRRSCNQIYRLLDINIRERGQGEQGKIIIETPVTISVRYFLTPSRENLEFRVNIRTLD